MKSDEILFLMFPLPSFIWYAQRYEKVICLPNLEFAEKSSQIIPFLFFP